MFATETKLITELKIKARLRIFFPMADDIFGMAIKRLSMVSFKACLVFGFPH